MIPTFENGERAINLHGQEVTIKRTEKDDQGFFVVFYDIDGAEESCYAVDCKKPAPTNS